MKDEINEGGQAFPVFGGEMSRLHEDYGMTMREYFAAKAMQAMVQVVMSEKSLTVEGASLAMSNIPSAAYGIADAMIKAREAS